MEAQGRALADLFDRESLRCLMEIDHSSQTYLSDLTQRALERGVAFAARSSENVAHEAVGMHADQHGLIAVLDIAAHQSHMRFAAINLAGVRDQAELAETSVN